MDEPERTDDAGFSFDSLRRFPDAEAPNLFAWDASDRLILDEAAATLTQMPSGSVSVVGDRYGALTLGAAATRRTAASDGASAVRTYQDLLTGERALAANADRLGLAGTFTSCGLDDVVTSRTRLVLMQLPRSLDELDEIACAVAENADPSVQLVAGGRIKHMTHAMNDVLGRWFGRVDARLARQKSRVLVACEPRAADGRPARVWPTSERHADLDLTVCSHGGAFAGTRVDIGTRFLLGFEDRMALGAESAVDLGCGTGVLAVALARSRPRLRVTATDVSSSAVASALASVQVNGVCGQVQVVRDDGAASVPDAMADLVVLNPPFHVGATVHSGVAHRLFGEAARVLRPGGELWVVWNSSLLYRPVLERLVGPTRQVGRNAKFTVTVSTKP